MVAVPLSAPFESGETDRQDSEQQFSIFGDDVDSDAGGNVSDIASDESADAATEVDFFLPQAESPPQTEQSQVEPEPAGAVAVENLTIADEAAANDQTTPAPPASVEISADTLAETVVLCHYINGQWLPFDQAEPPASDSPAIPASDSEYERKLTDAEREYIAACEDADRIENEIGALKEELKAAKELRSECYSRLQRIRSEGEGLPAPEQAVGESVSVSADSPANATPPASNSSNSPPPVIRPAGSGEDWWRVTPLRSIIEGIKGCGAKKLEAIVEKLPTLGDFVDLQGKTGGFGFHSEMPDGVGKKLCESMEDAVIEWLARNRDKFNEPVEQQPESQQPESLPAPQEALPAQGISMEAAAPDGTGASNEADDSGAEENIAPQPSPQDTPLPASKPAAKSEPKADDGDIHAAQINTRLQVLRLREGDERKPQNADIWDSGRNAARNEWPATDCNWTAGSNQDDWLLGWLYVMERKA